MCTPVGIAFLGRLSNEDLAAAVLSTTWFNFVNETMTGFMSAIDTLLAQSYGSRQYSTYAIWTGNSLVIVFFATIIASGIMALCGPFMQLIVSDPKLAQEAGYFALRLIPGLFPYYWFKVLTKYLQTQDILAPLVWVGLFANGMNAYFNWMLIYQVGLGIAGSPWATTLTRTVELLLLGLFMLFRRSTLEKTWPSVSCENISTNTLAPFMEIAIPGALGTLGEILIHLRVCILCTLHGNINSQQYDCVASFQAWGGFFEVTTILASFLGIAQLGAHAIALNIETFLYMSLCYAMRNAACILVGRAVGDRKPQEAKRSSHVSLFLSFIAALMVISILVCLRTELARLFSGDEEVSNQVARLIPIMCVFYINDAIVATTYGVFSGIGWQKWVLYISLIGCWVVAIPVAYALGVLMCLSFCKDTNTLNIYFSNSLQHSKQIYVFMAYGGAYVLG